MASQLVTTTLRAIYSDRDRYAGIEWTAGVIAGCKRPGTRLAALKRLVDDGHEVSRVSFTCPTQGIVVDGKSYVTMPLLDRGERIPYGPDWYKH